LEDRVLRARIRFKSMLAGAEEAADRAALERPGLVGSNATLIAMKAMNRAGGFLEAVSIVLPELGAELLDEFETFAARLHNLSQAAPDGSEPRTLTQSMPGDRRGWDRRLVHDRRRHQLEVAVDRRLTSERRADLDRRTGRMRELADRRFRAHR
jgi:hypothetical protein